MMVGFKLVAILIFVFAAIGFIHPSNWHPFMPNGWSGVLTGGSIIFFTYIGFDSVSTAAEECRNPQRDLPIGIIATLVVCTVLYVAVAVCLTGLVPWQSMVGDAAPVVNALKKLSLLPGGHPLYWVRLIVLLGALMGMISSILVYQIGQSRVWFSMSRDGLLPRVFSNVHPLFRTPAFSTWVAGIVVAIPSGLFDIGTLADLSNIGTLFAFVLVSIGVIVLRYREPDRRRGFIVPGGPVIPALSVLFCFLLMTGLPIITWYRIHRLARHRPVHLLPLQPSPLRVRAKKSEAIVVVLSDRSPCDVKIYRRPPGGPPCGPLSVPPASSPAVVRASPPALVRQSPSKRPEH